MSFPLLPLPGFLSSLAEIHLVIAWLVVGLGCFVGILILCLNAFVDPKYKRDQAIGGYICLGGAVVGAIFGVYILLAAGAVVVLYIAGWILMRVFIRNAIAVLWAKSEKPKKSE